MSMSCHLDLGLLDLVVAPGGGVVGSAEQAASSRGGQRHRGTGGEE